MIDLANDIKTPSEAKKQRQTLALHSRHGNLAQKNRISMFLGSGVLLSPDESK